MGGQTRQGEAAGSVECRLLSPTSPDGDGDERNDGERQAEYMEFLPGLYRTTLAASRAEESISINNEHHHELPILHDDGHASNGHGWRDSIPIRITVSHLIT